MHPYIDHDVELMWHRREVERFKENTYVCPPWEGCGVCNRGLLLPMFTTLRPIGGHFTHISKDPKLIAYTKDANNGERDIQTAMKPGRYLKQFYQDLSDTVIATLSGLLLLRGNEASLIEYGETPDDMERIFCEGPSTCMTKPTREYESFPIHPVRAYAGPDLKVAFIKNQQSGKIAVRALIWPEKKIYAQLVGDGCSGTYSTALAKGLESQGYTKGSLEGARISAIDPPTPTVGKRRFVAPVVDYCNSYRFDETAGYLVIHKDGPVLGNAYGTGIFV